MAFVPNMGMKSGAEEEEEAEEEEGANEPPDSEESGGRNKNVNHPICIEHLEESEGVKKEGEARSF